MSWGIFIYLKIAYFRAYYVIKECLRDVNDYTLKCITQRNLINMSF